MTSVLEEPTASIFMTKEHYDPYITCILDVFIFLGHILFLHKTFPLV